MQISLDVINLGSLISKDWGASYYTSKYKVSPVEVYGYTTDAEGERSGMGFTVMESFTDRVKIRSAPGKGTTVILEKRFDVK